MSRLYITASMPHKNWTGLALPTLSVETNDHTGGGINYWGLHPSSIAALVGKGPDVKKGERFDLKFNVNGSRSSAALVVNTTKHLPHVEWSSDGGLGKLPLAGAAALASKFVLGRDQSRRDPQRSKKLLKNSRSDRRREIESLPHPLRQSPNVSSSNTSRSSSSTTGKRSRAKEYQSNRASHVLTSSQSRQRSYDSSSDNPSCRWKKPIRDEKGYDSGYASGSDQTYDYNQVRSGPRRSSGRRSQRNTKR
ncbi:hypothetical protein N8I77_008591 [Diaporthe amygdali]|uniref:Uncharacterized protein n=1 Tax=Phomopsis amygdali TaxID=1214568 RepID=A0AAD9SEG9_PHOAM|nr:hypothetical protein N8I77_008591 [Diaporthe amygdali]